MRETSRHRLWLPLTSITALACLLAMAGLVSVAGAGTPVPEGGSERIGGYVRERDYAAYLSDYAGVPSPATEIVIPASSYSDSDRAIQVVDGPEGFDGKAVETAEDGYIEWIVDVADEGMYNIELQYMAVPGRSSSIERDLWINGERPFATARALVFPRVWEDSGPIRRDAAGNDVRPRQVEKLMWQTVQFRDSIGYVQEPLRFYFRQGQNTIRLTSLSEPMAIAYLKLHQVEKLKTYAEVAKEYDDKGYEAVEGVFVKVQAEDTAYRSSPSLFAVFDQGDPTLEPYDAALIRLNSVGGNSWQLVGDWITWEFEVPEDGLYQIALKAKQDQQRGMYSNRRLYIDGKVPFAEMDAVQFTFTDRYAMWTMGDEQEPYLFYLTRGKHELRLEVTLGNMADLLNRTEEILYELTSIYRSIIMVTSTNPDPLRSYQLDKRVPELLKRLGEMSEVIKEMAQDLEDLSGQRGGQTAVLRDVARLLDNMAANPEIIPNVFGAYRDGIGSLGTWVMTTRNQPLQMDYFVVSSPGAKLPDAAPDMGQTIKHELSALAASFTHDYNSISDINVDSARGTREPIRVWLGWGRDQAMVLKQMIEDTFTPETGIPVDLELVTNMHGLLIPSTLAGTAPDAALGAIDMDLAFRGAVADLAQFPDFNEVATRFSKSAFVHMTVRDRVYGLPETQSFPVLFYRRDILGELGLEIPDTWQDVYAMLPALRDHHMDFGLGASMGTFQMFLYQKGVPLFKEDMVETNLESEAAIKTFREMTDLFTLYEFPLQFDFVNRFRMGEMPMGIADYSLYNTLAVTAPELRGQWGFTCVPGTVQPDGTINRTVPAGSSGAIILNRSKKKADAWEFLKWWTSKETQVRYGRELEALMGAAARYATANVEAMKELPWRSEERNMLLKQWEWVEGTPPVLGGYYVTRQFDWLFRAVVIKNEPVRESVMDYNREINKEIARKREEYHYETKLSDLKQEWKDLYWDHYTHLFRLDLPEQELWGDVQ